MSTNMAAVMDLGSPVADMWALLTRLPIGLIAISLPVTLTLLYAFYNAFLHPLRHYPGPLLWQSFLFPYVIAMHKGELHRKLLEFHQKYGRVVRIAPNELSYADSDAWQDIYITKPGQQPFQRNRTWFKKSAPGEPMSIMGYDEEAHARFRRVFANSFSDKSLRDQAPVIESYVDLLMAKLRQEKTVNLERIFNHLTFDISADLSFGESFECLESGKTHPWVEVAHGFGKGLALVSSINQYPPIDKLLRYIIPKKVIQRMKSHAEMSQAKARKRLALDTNRPDFVTPAKRYADQKNSMSDAEWDINLMIIIFAASETLSSALTATVRELVQHPGALYRAAQEIRSAFAAESDITIATTGNLPYLNAVINESFRLAPPSGIGTPRVVPTGGATVCGSYVPGGTYVAYNQYPANRQSHNFSHPNSFIPERFLPQTSASKTTTASRTDNLASLQPFQVGRNNCIGMKFAWAEMRVVLARLLWAFDITLKDEKDRWDWGTQDTFIFWEKRPLEVVLTPVVR